MKTWCGLLSIVACYGPNNDDLVRLQRSSERHAAQGFRRQKGIEKHAKRIVDKWDSKLLPLLERRNCLATEPKFVSSDDSSCANEAQQYMRDDFFGWLDAYVNTQDRDQCKNILARQKAKVQKMLDRMAGRAIDNDLWKCSNGERAFGKGFVSVSSMIKLGDSLILELLCRI